MAGRVQVRLHRDRNRRDDRRRVQGTKYAGYVAAGEQIASRPTRPGGTADTINIANRAAIDYSVAAVVYTDTITYTVTPNYT